MKHKLKHGHGSKQQASWKMGVLAWFLAGPVFLAGGGLAAADPWDDTVAKGKEEGKVVIVMGGAASREFAPIFPVFEKKFGIQVIGSSGSGRESADRILAERRAGIHTADLWYGGTATMNTRLVPQKVLDPVEPELILPEVVDTSKWWGGKRWYGDHESKYILLFAATPSNNFSVNTKLVDLNKINSFFDLLDPKWKGKIVSRDPSSTGVGLTILSWYAHPKLGKDFIRRLYTEMNVTLVRDFRQGADWLAKGKFAFYIMPGRARQDVEKLAQLGLPVQNVYKPLKEGAELGVGGTSSAAVINNRPHPYAARVFLNWWLSRDGQIAFMNAGKEDDSMRIDIPKDVLEERLRRKSNVEYIFSEADPEIQKLFSEAFDYASTVLKG
ncbi:MAG TPA: extracellular solute-binding protein, partial [Candidatus Binatia bacterium]